MSKTPKFATPEDAEDAFYDAIANGDADLLMHYWSEEDEIMCVHPTGVRLMGQAPIRESWRGIFGNASLRIEGETMARWQSAVMAVHHLTESLYVGDDPVPHGPLHVTHLYNRGVNGWRLVSRHASAADGGEQALADGVPYTLH